MSSRALLSLVVLLLFAGCASPPVSIVLLEERSEWPVRYRASASSATWGSGDVSSDEASSARAGVPPSSPQIVLECQTLRAPTTCVNAWSQDARAVYGLDVPRGAVDALLQAPDVEVVTAPRIVLSSGARGTIELANQRAFVASFDVVGAGAALIADPVVSVARDGLRMDIKAAVADEGIELEFSAELVQLQQLAAGRPVQLPVGAPVHIQQPVTVLQQVETKGVLARDRQLVVCTPSGEPGSSYLLVLGAEEAARVGAQDAVGSSRR